MLFGVTDNSDELAAYVSRCFEDAKIAKMPVEMDMLRSLRQRDGIYEADKLKEINKLGGSDIYMLLTKAKCRDAEAWLRDVLVQSGLLIWDVQATPVPEGYVVDKVQDMDFIKSQTLQMRDKLHDQLIEGRWYEALEEVIYDIVTFKSAFIKGPVLRREFVRKRVFNEDSGVWEFDVVKRLMPVFERRSPFDIFPAPDSTAIDDAYLIDRLYIAPEDLVSMVGSPGFNAKVLNELLEEKVRGRTPENVNHIISDNGGRYAFTSLLPIDAKANKFEVLEFWGTVEGRLLLGQKDIECILDEYFKEDDREGAPSHQEGAPSHQGGVPTHQGGVPTHQGGVPTHQGGVPTHQGGVPTHPPSHRGLYNVCVWVCGGRVLRVMLNPDPQGGKPFSKVSFEEVPGKFWGFGLCELIADVQRACNAISRAIINNVGIASGPQVERNVERLAPGQSKDVWPWKVWDATDMQMTGAPALRFYQPELVVDKLMSVYEFYLKRADEQAGIPSYSDGAQVKGVNAMATASGLAMFMTHSARGIKAVIKNIDSKIIKTSLERQYKFNLDYELDGLHVPDVKIVAKGASSLIAREQQAMRRTEFLQATNNPVDVEIMGLEGRRHLLREIAQSLEVDVDKVVPKGLPYNNEK
ncbi:MAG: hypothetical protein L3V56_02330 [Candidatus Magnetoovum sp. WYHC-5]|nr:hypothetical protein [Candidatus Magnetoovum sp. WYHC-5]